MDIIAKKIKQKETEFFEIPNSSVKGIPLRMNGNNLELAILEVGYKPKGKRKQLKKNKFAMKNNNSRIYEDELKIHNGIVHYSHSDYIKMDKKSYEIEYIICYKRLSSRMLEQFYRRDIKQLMGLISDSEPDKKELREILLNKDANALEAIMKEYGDSDGYRNFKGGIAEMMAFKDIMKELPAGINFFSNIEFQYYKKSKIKDTEVDGIFTFYEIAKFAQLLKNLNRYDSLEVKVNGRLSRYHI